MPHILCQGCSRISVDKRRQRKKVQRSKITRSWRPCQWPTMRDNALTSLCMLTSVSSTLSICLSSVVYWSIWLLVFQFIVAMPLMPQSVTTGNRMSSTSEINHPFGGYFIMEAECAILWRGVIGVWKSHCVWFTSYTSSAESLKSFVFRLNISTRWLNQSESIMNTKPS